MRKRRIFGSVAAVMGLTAAGMAFTAGTASATGYEYNGGCGSGYEIIDSMNVGTGPSGGISYLTYNFSNGYNCVVTVRGSVPSTYMIAQLRISGGTWVKDAGYYHSYAGPVYVYAADKCIDWGGYASDAGPGTPNIQSNEHCG